MILYYSTKLVNEMMAYFHLKSSSYFYVNIIIVEALVGMLRVSPPFQAPPIHASCMVRGVLATNFGWTIYTVLEATQPNTFL
jgi:hypothetical protein